MHGIEALIARYGLIVVATGALFEGESVITLAGFAAHQGVLSPVAVALTAMAAAFAADQGIYWLTRKGRDRPLVRRLAQSRAGRVAIGAVKARPLLFVLGFRFMIGLRTVGPVAIALAGVPPGRFAMLNAVSAAVWAVLWTGLGYGAGAAVIGLLGDLGKFEHKAMTGLAIAGAVAGLLLLARHHILRRRAD